MLSSTLNDLQTQKSSKEKNVIVFFFIEKGFLKRINSDTLFRSIVMVRLQISSCSYAHLSRYLGPRECPA